MTSPPIETLLHSIAQSAPRPWYPVDFAQTMGMPRERLDGPLDQLRLAGLIAFTPWISGKGQGYEATPHGIAVLNSPRLMAGLKRGYLPQPREIEPEENFAPHLAGTDLARGEIVIRALADRRKPSLTKVLIIINLIVFAAGIALMVKDKIPLNQALMGGNLGGRNLAAQIAADKAAHATGSIRGDDILKGEWWRLLTCCFVHHGGLHLAMNMYSLWVLGSIVESLWGRWRFLAIYMLAGFGGSCAAMWFAPQGNLAGASGAIWGLMASYPIWLIVNRAFLPPQIVSDALRGLVPVIVMNVFISFIPGISKEAHFGGGIIGAAAAALLNFHRFGRDPMRWLWIGLVALIPVLSVGALIQAKQANPRWIKDVKIMAADNRINDENSERADFKKHYLNGTDSVPAVRLLAKRIVGRAEHLRNIPRNERAEQDLAIIRAEINSLNLKIDDLSRRLENAGPYESDFLRDAIREIQAALRDEKAVLELYDQNLTDANWGDLESQKLDDAIVRSQNAWRTYEGR